VKRKKKNLAKSQGFQYSYLSRVLFESDPLIMKRFHARFLIQLSELPSCVRVLNCQLVK